VWGIQAQVDHMVLAAGEQSEAVQHRFAEEQARMGDWQAVVMPSLLIATDPRARWDRGHGGAILHLRSEEAVDTCFWAALAPARAQERHLS